jgi:hypothetical protein
VPRSTMTNPNSTARSWLAAAMKPDRPASYYDILDPGDHVGFCLPLHTSLPPTAPPSVPPPPAAPSPMLPPPMLPPPVPCSPPPPWAPPQSRACSLLPGSCALEEESWYCFVVQPINAHGLKGERTRSNGIRACGPPVAGTVVEVWPWPVPPGSTYWGIHALADYTHYDGDDQLPPTQDRDATGSNVLRVRWHGFKDECALGIETYHVSLLLKSDSAEAANTQTWRVVNSSTLQGVSAPIHVVASPQAERVRDFVLDESGLYCVRVCGLSVSGLSACAESDGIYYDTTPPTTGALCVHAGTQRWCTDTSGAHANGKPTTAYVSHVQLGGLRASWHGFADSESRIAGFSWAVGREMGGSDVQPWTPSGWSTGTALASISLWDKRLYLSVSCVNGVGLVSNATIVFVIDSKPPRFEHGVLALLEWSLLPHELREVNAERSHGRLFTQHTQPTIVVNTSCVSDAHSPVLSIELQLLDVRASIASFGAVAIATIPINLTAGVGELQHVTFTHSLSEHARYEILVTATNAAGLRAFHTAELRVDPDVPINGALHFCNRQAQPALAWPSNRSVSVCARVPFGHPTSGLHHAISLLSATTSEILGEALVPHSNEPMLLAGLELPCGKAVLLESVALSGVGVPAMRVHGGHAMIIDCTPPVSSAVGFTTSHRGLPAVTAMAFCAEPTDATYGWWKFEEPEGGQLQYEIAFEAIARPPSSDLAQSMPLYWEYVGPRDLALLQLQAMLSTPVSYILHIRACNTASLCSDAVSEPLIITTSPPDTFAAHLGSVGQGARFLSPFDVHVSWALGADASFAAVDPLHPGMALTYEVCIGTSPFGCQVQPFLPAGNGTSWRAENLTLSCGRTYYAAVRATNCAGLQRTVASNSATVCCEPPTSGTLALVDDLGPVTAIDGNSSSLVTWTGFRDTCSGLSHARLTVTDRLTQVMVWNATLDPDERSVELPLGVVVLLDHATRYTVAITYFNHAAMTATSDTLIVVDRTAPEVSGVEVRWDTTSHVWHALDGAEPICLPSTADFFQIRWLVFDDESSIATHEYDIVGSVVEAPSWKRASAAVALQFSSDSLPGQDGGMSFFPARVCNRVDLCAVYAPARGLCREKRPPSGGVVQLLPSNATSSGFIQQTEVVISISDFVAAGCPPTCGENASRCYFDATCDSSSPRLGGHGCNAAGVGTQCRWCGAPLFEPCPPQAPVATGVHPRLEFGK